MKRSNGAVEYGSNRLKALKAKQFIFTPLAKRLLAKLEWGPITSTITSTRKVELHALPDPKFVVRRTTNPTKFTADDFR